jgi:predicted ester cyclase
MGVPATGRDVTIAGLVISRFRDGKVVEEWEVADVFGLMQQIGAVPEMAQS